MRKILNIVLISYTLILSIEVKSQDRPAYSLYTMYHPLYNPAAMGAYDVVNGLVLFNYRMAGFEGAPLHVAADVSLPLGKSASSIGTQLVYEQMGARRRIVGGISYAHRVKLNIRNYLSFGVSAMFQNLNFNWGQLQHIDMTDVLITSQQANYWAPDFRIGGYYFSTRAYAGFSVGNLISIGGNGDIGVSINNTHFYLQGGYAIPIGTKWEFRPSALIKYVVGAPLQSDLNVMFSYRDVLSFGASYRTVNTIIANLQVRILPYMRLGYAFNAGLGMRDNTFNSGHEVVLSFNGINKKQNLGVRCPRF